MKNEKQAVSIVSVYDGSNYTTDYVKSIQNQLFENYELILINDRRGGVCERLAEQIIGLKFFIGKTMR